MKRILGIDPGLQRTGWGVISADGPQLSFIAAGVITSNPKAPMPERLLALHEGIQRIVTEHVPHAAAIEETFVNMNSASSLKLAQARGALMLSLSIAGLEVQEFAANLIKKTVTGSGHADKTQITRMVQMQLPKCKEHGADAMDALAVAICRAQFMKSA